MICSTILILSFYLIRQSPISDAFVLPSPSPCFSSRASIRRRQTAILQTFKSPDNSMSNSVISFFERAVQSLTGDEDYQFGDISRKTLSDLTNKDLSTEAYEFGDISRNFIKQTGKAVTGKEDYEFGDITKGFLKDTDATLQSWRGQALNDLPVNLLDQTLKKLTPNERKVLLVALIRWLAIALCAWGLCANLCTSFSVTAAWTKASWVESTRGVWNPFAMGAIHQQVFLRTYAFTRIVMDPFFLLVQGAGTLFLVFPYQRFVRSIEEKQVPEFVREKYPLLARVSALGLSFMWNLGITVALSALGLGFGTLLGQLRLRWLLP